MDTFVRLVQTASAKHKTISSCESLTAGLFCASIGAVPGASAVLKGGLVTYFTQMKEVLAHVNEDIIEQNGVVSDACAKAMAENTRQITGSDYCVSFTGNAGPDVMEGKPAGLVYCGLADEKGCEVFELHMQGSRNEIRQSLCEIMAAHLLDRLNDL